MNCVNSFWSLPLVIILRSLPKTKKSISKCVPFEEHRGDDRMNVKKEAVVVDAFD